MSTIDLRQQQDFSTEAKKIKEFWFDTIIDELRLINNWK